jgi:hypothetical protein
MTKDSPDREKPEEPPGPERPTAPADKPALPDRSRDETDVGWGERPDPDDDERLTRDRPPHWSDY